MANDHIIVEGSESVATTSKASNTKWNDDAHQALCGTVLEMVEGAVVFGKPQLDRMVEIMGERGHNFSREGIRFLHINFRTTNKPPSSIKHYKMPSAWDDVRQKDLLEEIFFITNPQLTQGDKDNIVQGMKQRGHADLTWNAIRHLDIRLAQSTIAPTHQNLPVNYPRTHLSEKPQTEGKMTPRTMYDSLEFWRDLAVATYDITAPSSAAMAQIIEKAEAIGGYDINQNGL
ncbi:hypothetical protein SLS53_001220 [Cytospora paraplurivora]|uniref:Uncharacterized protein n=1 Tax=Cytospora paraplurivora TaxID=2898453 RepID=A0AAN9USU6_9PEZI